MVQELLFNDCAALEMIHDDEMRHLITAAAEQIAVTLRQSISHQESSRDFGALEARVSHLEDSQETILGKLDKLLDAAAMGRGAWWMILKMGGILAALAAGGAWAYDHLFFPGK